MFALWSGCGDASSAAPGAGEPAATGSKACGRAQPPEKFDPHNVSWELVVPPHGQTPAITS
jgi:hypothetical protein